MASSGNNITAVHFSLIFFVMLSIILGVVAYLGVDKQRELRGKAAKAEEDRAKLDKQWNNYRVGYQDVAKRVGVNPDLQDGAVNVGGSQTALAEIQAMLEKIGEKDSTLRVALTKKLDALVKEQATLAEQKKRLEDATAQYKKDVDAANKSYKDAQAEMTKAQTEATNAKKEAQDAETKRQNAEKQHVAALNALRTEKTRLEDNYKKQVEGLKKEISDLSDTIARKQDIIDKLVNTSFERPDGIVRYVDYTTKIVWINLGKEDKLPERMTFSVYSQKHQGVARDSERFEKLRTLLDRDLKNKVTDTRQRNNQLDKLIGRAKAITHDRGTRGVSGGDIKGAIEVTRIVDAHLAEARILTSDPYDPIGPGDPIYTPLWSPGIEERFAFAVELDGKQFSGLDWPLLKRIVKAANAKIDAELDAPTGKIIYTDGGISDKTKFLVITDLLPPDQAADPKEKQRRLDMAASQKKLREDAQKFGVRVVKLSDFLQYLGYKPDRRLWRPGDDTARKLKAGARSTTVDQVIGRRESSGQTSGIFTRRGRLKQPKSSGQTSKVFGGNRGY